MTKLKTISKSLNIERLYINHEKLMVIIDTDNLPILDALLQINNPRFQVIYVITDSPEIRLRYKSMSRIYPLNVNIRSLLRFDIVDEILCCTCMISAEMLDNLKKISNEYGVPLLFPDSVKLTGIEIMPLKKMKKTGLNVLETTPRKKFIFILKNWLEVLFATIALIVLLPLLLSIAIAIKADSKGPVIFRQLRVGRRGRKFYIYKFRTMIVDAEKLKARLASMNEADGPVFKIKDDPRITAVGKILRRTGLDEMPQLLNVLSGNMSLIGPRPLVPNEVMAHEEWQLKRLCIKPGITCSWQIKPDRNKVPFDEWMKLDREYIENWSITDDVKIFFGTIRTFFIARGL